MFYHLGIVHSSRLPEKAHFLVIFRLSSFNRTDLKPCLQPLVPIMQNLFFFFPGVKSQILVKLILSDGGFTWNRWKWGLVKGWWPLELDRSFRWAHVLPMQTQAEWSLHPETDIVNPEAGGWLKVPEGCAQLIIVSLQVSVDSIPWCFKFELMGINKIIGGCSWTCLWLVFLEMVMHRSSYVMMTEEQLVDV